MGVIYVSAGHYPEKPGACYGDFCEHGEATAWAIQITDQLIRAGEDARLVPTGHLREKVAFINGGDAALAIEVHFNSFKVWKDANADGLVTDDELMHAGKGCETLFFPGSEKGAYLANEIQRVLAPAMFKDRGIKPGYYRMNPKNGPDFFLAKTKCPSAILEPDFIHQKEWIQSNRELACVAIADALIKTKSEFTDGRRKGLY